MEKFRFLHCSLIEGILSARDKSPHSSITQRIQTMKLLRILPSIFFLVLIALPAPVRAQDQADLDEFSVIMEHLIDKVATFESAYNPSLAGNIARTRRLEVYSVNAEEIDAFAQEASGRTDPNSMELWTLTEAVRSMDPTSLDFLPILEELWVRSVVLECEDRGITTDVVGAYIRREAASFVANRGDFTHPEFDESTLGGEDHIRIYFAGFGMVVLVHMNGGVEKAIELYEESSDLRGYFANQLVFRGVDLDVDGLPMLESVLFDPELSPSTGEYFYGLMAGKLVGPGGQFGGNVVLSNEWKETLSEWTYEYIRTPERLEARMDLPLYGVRFEEADLGPEAFLGLLGPSARQEINSLLAADDLMQNVSGLEALRWFDRVEYSDDAGFLFSIAEPIMTSTDFTLAVLAKEAYDADARYMGEPYDEARRERLQSNLPALCDLLDRALEHPGVEFLSSTAWLDIFEERSLRDELECTLPMIAQVVVSDWTRHEEGEEVYPPEGEIEILTYFLPTHVEYFETTSDAVRGFVEDELDSGEVNPFRVWTYVDYLEAAKEGGGTMSEEWISTLVRLRAWVDNAPALISGDELKSTIDELMW